MNMAKLSVAVLFLSVHEVAVFPVGALAYLCGLVAHSYGWSWRVASLISTVPALAIGIISLVSVFNNQECRTAFGGKGESKVIQAGGREAMPAAI